MANLEIDLFVNNLTKKGLASTEKEVKTFMTEMLKKSEEFADMFSDVGDTNELKKTFAELSMSADLLYRMQDDSVKKLEKGMQEASLALKYISDMINEVTEQFQNGQIKEEEYIESMAKLSVLKKQIGDASNEMATQLREEAAASEMAEGSINSLQAQLSLLTAEYQKLGADDREGDAGQKILEDMKEVSHALEEAKAGMREYEEVSVDAYSAIDAMVERLAANLPSLVNNPLSLAKQLPSMIEKLQQAQEEYEQFTEDGDDSEPVWKQLIGATLNWKTALIALVPIIIKNREAIAEWFNVLATGHSITIKHRKAVKEVAKAMSDDLNSLSGSILNLKNLQTEWSKLTSDEEREAWAKKNSRAFEEMGVSIQNAADAENLLSNPDHVNALIESMKTRVAYTAAMKLATEEYEKVLKKQIEGESDQRNIQDELDKYKRLEQQTQQRLDEYKRNGRGKNEIKAAEAELENYRKRIQKLEDELAKKKGKLEKKTEDNVAAIVNPYVDYAQTLLDEATKKLTENGLTPADKLTMEQEEVLEKLSADDINARNAYYRRKLELEASYAKLLADHRRDMQADIANAEIAAMKDGNEKELAQIGDSFLRRKEALDKQKDDYIRSVVDAEEQIFNAQEQEKRRLNKDYILKQFNRDEAAKNVDVSGFDELQNANLSQFLNNVDNFYDNLRSRYETYEQAIERINKRYDDDIAAMRDKDGSFLAGFSQENVDEAQKLRQGELDNLYAQFDKTYQKIFRDVSKMSKQSIKEALDAAKAWVIDPTHKDSPLMADMQARVDELQEAFDNWDWEGFESGWDGVSRRINNVLSLQKKLKDTTGLTAEEQDKITEELETQQHQLKNALVATGIDAFTGALSDIAGMIGQIADIADSGSLRDLGNALGVVSNTLSGAAAGAAGGGGWIGAAIGAVVSLGGSLAGLITDMEVSKAQWTALMEELKKADRYKLTDWDSVFGTQEVARASEAYNVAQKALKDYMSQLYELQHRTAHARGKNNKSDMLGNLDIWDKDGMLDLDKARAVLESSEMQRKANDNVRKALADAIVMQEAYLDAMSVVDDYINGMVGNIADNLADAIWKGIEDGSDAWENFQDSANDTIRSIAKSMIKEMLVTKMLNDWKQKLETAVGSGDNETIVKTFTDFVTALQTYIPEAQEEAKKLNDIVDRALGEAVGDESATAKGIAQASQDSIDELNGRFSAIQTHTFTLNENVKQLTTNSGSMLGMMNTLLQHTSNLELMREYLYRIEASTDKMATKGVTML